MGAYGRGLRVCARSAAALLAVLLASGCAELFTGDGGSERKNWAVVVGVSSHQSSTLNLKWAEEDALDVYDALRRGKGWETDRMTLLTNSAATREAVKSALAGLAKRVGTDDQVVFYFSGRGSYGVDQPPYDEGDGLDEYLVPYDALPGSTAHDLSDDDLETLLAALPTNNVVVILDAGFAGASSRIGSPSAKEKCVVRPGSGRAVSVRSVDGMGHELARPGYVFMTAALGGSAPSESAHLRNGVFTHYFVEGLRGPANAGKKSVSASQAFAYAASRTATFESGQSPQLFDNSGKESRLAAY